MEKGEQKGKEIGDRTRDKQQVLGREGGIRKYCRYKGDGSETSEGNRR